MQQKKPTIAFCLLAVLSVAVGGMAHAQPQTAASVPLALTVRQDVAGQETG